MALTDRPSFSELSGRDCVELLKRNHVGRIAFTFHDRVDIEPMSYVFAEDWLYGRTSPGTKVATVRHHPWVAFEVDEIEGRFDWRSVVVHGSMHLLEPDGGDRDRETYAAAIELLRHAGQGRQRVAVLATMLELGVTAPQLHDDVARSAVRSNDQLPAASAVVWPSTPTLPWLSVTTTPGSAVPWKTSAAAFVMPSVAETPVSGLVPVMTGVVRTTGWTRTVTVATFESEKPSLAT